MKIILDANIYLSAILYGSVKLEQLILFCFESFEVIICEDLLEEVDRKMQQEIRLSTTKQELLAKIRQYGSVYQIQKRTKFLRDPKDAYLLDLANTSSASFLITGDKDLLSLEIYQKTKILSPRAFVDLVEQSQ